MPETDCLKSAIELTPGIVRVTYDGETAKPGSSKPTLHLYFYETSNDRVSAALTVGDLRNGRVTITNHFDKVNERPTQRTVDFVRSVMSDVEMNIAKKCGIDELPKIIKETCAGVDCSRPASGN